MVRCLGLNLRLLVTYPCQLPGGLPRRNGHCLVWHRQRHTPAL